MSKPDEPRPTEKEYSFQEGSEPIDAAPPPPSADRVDQTTVRAYGPSDDVPPRTSDLTTTSYNDLSDPDLWEEISQIRPVAIVAVKRPDRHRGQFRGHSLINNDEAQVLFEEVLRTPGVAKYEEPDCDFTMPTLRGGDYPAIVVTLESIDALIQVRTYDFVDYVEPLYFYDQPGCALDAYTPDSADEQFTPEPGRQRPDRVSWAYRHMAIQEAWGLFNNGYGRVISPGRNVTIGVIDTGLYADAPQFDRATFVLPDMTRKPPERHSTLADNAVRCSHGTRMAGVAVAPAAGVARADGANFVGVAWGSDLVAVKVGDGVVQGGANIYAVVAGLDLAVSRGARVLTLAFGLAYTSEYLRTNIERIFDDHPGVLMVSAAGTYISWVSFPANMDREVVAATIVDFRPSGTVRYRKIRGLDYFPDAVAYGPSVDFATVSSPKGIATQGNASHPLTSVAGSSSGTALLAGIAALVWSRIPELSRAQLRTRLAEASTAVGIEGEPGLVIPSREVGFGIPDAYRAAGGCRAVYIAGPVTTPPGKNYNLTANTDGYDPHIDFKWDTGETARSVSATAGAEGMTRSHTVTATHRYGRRTISTTHTVTFAGSHRRRIYSDELVSEWATFFNGKRVDRVVNIGRRLPAGCSIIDVLGLEYRPQNGVMAPYGGPRQSADNGGSGFTVNSAPGAGPASLDAWVHVWHDGLSAIRVRVVYDVWEADHADAVEVGVTLPSP